MKMLSFEILILCHLSFVFAQVMWNVSSCSCTVEQTTKDGTIAAGKERQCSAPSSPSSPLKALPADYKYTRQWGTGGHNQDGEDVGNTRGKTREGTGFQNKRSPDKTELNEQKMKTSNKKFRTWHLVLERADWLQLPWSGTLALSFWYRSPSLPTLPLFLHFLQLLFPVPHDCSNVSKTIVQIGQLPCIVSSCVFFPMFHELAHWDLPLCMSPPPPSQDSSPLCSCQPSLPLFGDPSCLWNDHQCDWSVGAITPALCCCLWPGPEVGWHTPPSPLFCYSPSPEKILHLSIWSSLPSFWLRLTVVTIPSLFAVKNYKSFIFS